MWHKLLKMILVALLLMSNQNLSNTSPEQQVEDMAEAIEKSAIFTQWPKSHEQGILASNFVITVIGNRSVNDAIKSLYSNKKIKDKVVKVNYLDVTSLPKLSENNLKMNHILFIPTISDNDLHSLLVKTSKLPILTMSNTSGYAQKGVILNFYDVNNKMPFEVNFNCLKQSGIYIDALLLENVTIVEPKKDW